MNRKLRAFGLGLLAVLATSAVAAPSASAVTDVVTASQPTVLMTGVSHDNIISLTPNLTFQCTTTKFVATTTNIGQQITVDPLYEGKVNEASHGKECTASGGGSVKEVRTNGCHYKLSGTTNASGDGPIWIECPGTNKIEFVSSLGYVISIPSQTPTSGGVSYSTIMGHPGGSSIKLKETIEGITYTCAPAIMCAMGGLATHANNADINGTMILTGYEDLDGLPTPVTEGAQIGISMS
jgi:hypothetical protein